MPIPRASASAHSLPFACAFLLVATFLCFTSAHASSPPPPPPAGPSAPGSRPLSNSIPDLLAHPHFTRATWGIRIARADSGIVLFETNALKLLKPASNAKLLTAALVLDTFGPDHRIRTDLIPTGPISPDGTLRGDLILYGRGDFSFAARFHDGRTGPALDPIIEALARAGLRRIEGAIIADDSYFQGAPFGGGWTWDDLQYYYGAEVGALNVDDNVLDFTLRPGPRAGDPVTLDAPTALDHLAFHLRELHTAPPGFPRRVEVRRDPGSRDVLISGSLPVGGSPWPDAVTLPEPGLFFARRLHHALGARGIPVRDRARREPGAARRGISPPSPGTPPPIAVESRPLAERVRCMLKPSQNLYAQLLLLEAGTHLSPAESGETSEARGLRALGLFIARAGIPASEVLMDDGSGLSRSTLVTPAALVRLLQHMDRHPQRSPFLDALPVAGVDGTLRARMRDTPAAGNLRAKTGSLRFVNTLSGFVTNAAGHRLVFSLMLNAYQAPAGAPSGREALDSVAELLARSRE